MVRSRRHNVDPGPQGRRRHRDGRGRRRRRHRGADEPRKVELFASPITRAGTAHEQRGEEPVWSATNVTGAASGAPPLGGSFSSARHRRRSRSTARPRTGVTFLTDEVAGVGDLERNRRLSDGRHLGTHRGRRGHRYSSWHDVDAVRRRCQLTAAPGRRCLRDSFGEVDPGRHGWLADRE